MLPSACNERPSKHNGDVPALLFKDNRIHKPMGANAESPHPWRSQTLIAELNGVFVHLDERDGNVHVVVADKRLEP